MGFQNTLSKDVKYRNKKRVVSFWLVSSLKLHVSLRNALFNSQALVMRITEFSLTYATEVSFSLWLNFCLGERCCPFVKHSCQIYDILLQPTPLPPPHSTRLHLALALTLEPFSWESDLQVPTTAIGIGNKITAKAVPNRRNQHMCIQVRLKVLALWGPVFICNVSVVT